MTTNCTAVPLQRTQDGVLVLQLYRRADYHCISATIDAEYTHGSFTGLTCLIAGCLMQTADQPITRRQHEACKTGEDDLQNGPKWSRGGLKWPLQMVREAGGAG